MMNDEGRMTNGGLLAQRAVLRGVQCVCGQWWPDYVMRGGLAHMECCGSVYEVRPATSGVVLSLRDAAGKMMEGKMISERDAAGVSHHSTPHDFTKSEVPVVPEYDQELVEARTAAAFARLADEWSEGLPVSSSPSLQVSQSAEGGGL